MKTIIHNPISTEKAIRLMESENKLLFEVSLDSNKIEIKQEVEKLFKVKVLKVNTFISTKGKKKAYVKLSMDTPAMDVATNLGLI
ncbi:50S ribosomal protein L23 [Candidatus Woesearchaeota archaeon]|nr:50S ribosomal protein L23 [Candidatus Woesearchaeota archaeon]